jgi:hypothetical protein
VFAFIYQTTIVTRKWVAVKNSYLMIQCFQSFKFVHELAYLFGKFYGETVL